MHSLDRFRRHLILASAAAGAVAISSHSLAQGPERRSYRVEAQDLGSALRAFALQSGHDIMVSADLVAGRSAPRLEGRFTLDQALAILLEGSGLTTQASGDAILIRGRAAPSDAIADRPTEEPEILVTATRIRGAPVASPTIRIGQERMRDEGQSNLGEVIRAIPQNFSGGQNPGVTEGSERNQNLNAASSLNLRGLGPDATLTLLNGHRLSYDSIGQGIDISAIPLAAVERLDIVADGASAIYGSDAVGGVANIILKRDFQGLTTSARVGASTDGGNVQQQYDAVTGTAWPSGGIIASASYGRSSAIKARDRSYTQTVDGSFTLVPRQKNFNMVLSGHQDLGDRVHVEADGLYSWRRSEIDLPFSKTMPVTTSGLETHPTLRSFAISPKLTVDLPGRWSTSLSATYAQDRTAITSLTHSGGTLSRTTDIRYNNRLFTAELGAEGPLFTLPGGDGRLALGGGYRTTRISAFNEVHSMSGDEVTLDFDHSRRSYYGYGEVYLPLISPELAIGAIRRLSVSGAVRYERYPGMASIATPKLGLIYEPIADLTLKGSWGRSFKAPTLFQQYGATEAILVPADFLTGMTFPPGSTTLLLASGNPDLKPEKATTWTVTGTARPRFAEGLTLEISYFNIHYRDRVIRPISTFEGLYSNPIYQFLIRFDPSPGQVNDAVDRAAAGLVNLTGGDFSPDAVVAIVDNSNRNAARQTLHGLDLSADYAFDLRENGRLTARLDATYLHSSQILLPGTAPEQLAGTIYDPPHWRARAGLVWQKELLTLATNVSRIGGVDDNRPSIDTRIASMTTWDLTARIRLGVDQDVLPNIEIALSALNILNDKPDRIDGSQTTTPPFDSTNYSSIGRFLGLTVTKSW